MQRALGDVHAWADAAAEAKGGEILQVRISGEGRAECGGVGGGEPAGWVECFGGGIDGWVAVDGLVVGFCEILCECLRGKASSRDIGVNLKEG